ncbi:hypothetical protein EMPS_03361 [Entomortierella parvispora]|uniref:Uncharacterized protein n=1 Tax=Entomortierella parvispora TaxID=205924 RepID=A0A9P3H6M3_9FUNG|nr:hypothetical protein EMPS_03361 [Entomortierella parvispora]
MHRILSISILLLTWTVLSVLAKTVNPRQDSIYATPHPAHKHQDFKHRHHQPILSGSLFPEAKIATPTDPVTHKEPCPRGCVNHGDDFYLAVTSLGDGFPRIQYTCSHPNHAQAIHDTHDIHGNHGTHGTHDTHDTHDTLGAYSHSDHSGSKDHAKAEFLDPAHPRVPADPQPEQTPTAHPGHEHHGHGDNLLCGEGSTLYSDLHITACTKRHNPSEGNVQPTARDQSTHGAAVSPHERVSEDDSELHTTTLTYSHDDHPPVRSVQLTDDNIVHSTSLIGHHQYIPADLLKDWEEHQRYGEKDDNLERMPSIVDDMTTPEPIVSIAAPTSSPSHHDAAAAVARHLQEVADRKAHRDEEEKAGPAAPSPEPMPAAATTVGSGRKDNNKINGPHDPFRHISYQTIRHHEQEVKPLKEGDVQGFRTVVHRVTTLIIEKETIVAHQPQATPHSHLDAHHGESDHIMFDAGMEGDRIVSIAHNDYHQKEREKAHADKSKSRDEL